MEGKLFMNSPGRSIHMDPSSSPKRRQESYGQSGFDFSYQPDFDYNGQLHEQQHHYPHSDRSYYQHQQQLPSERQQNMYDQNFDRGTVFIPESQYFYRVPHYTPFVVPVPMLTQNGMVGCYRNVRVDNSGAISAGHKNSPVRNDLKKKNQNNIGGQVDASKDLKNKMGESSLNDKYRKNSKGPQQRLKSRDNSGPSQPVAYDINSFPQLNLGAIPGNVNYLARDPIGCRFLQAALVDDTVDSALKTLMYNESRDDLKQLLSDPFGNYFFQKLYETISNELKQDVVQILASELCEASKGIHATRSVQRLIELSCHDDVLVDAIVAALKTNVIDLCIDGNGCHVIQSCIKNLKAKKCEFIVDAIMLNCIKVSNHRQGCCIVQKCLELQRENGQNSFLKEVLNHSVELMQDAYGNYVVQFILDNFDVPAVQVIYESICGLILPLSMQKFSSNVVEKCIMKAPSSLHDIYLDEIIAPSTVPGKESTLMALLVDRYGNYIIQKALTSFSTQNALLLCKSMIPYINSAKLVENSGGRRMYLKVQKIFPELFVSETVPVPYMQGA